MGVHLRRNTHTFDEQNRLSSATVKQGSSTLAITDFAFDDLGNLTHKSDITSLGSTSLAYAMTGNAGPHAVTSLSTGSGSVNFSYDANGNLTSGDAGNTGRTIAWSAYDKPVEITQGAITRTFAYGPDRQRYQQVHDEGSGPTTTTYVGDYYTRIDAGGGNELHKLYLYANGRVIAIVEDDADTGAGSTNTRYLHRDHLGSITLIVDDSGLERLSYDAWGQRRDATDWVGAPATTPTEVRGYTGHEHLDDVNLIHMNGRLYDPQLGRMVSGDPIIPDPMNSQSFNRYSYVNNNPLGYVDPSGFSGIEIAIAWVINLIIKSMTSGSSGDGAPYYDSFGYYNDFNPVYYDPNNGEFPPGFDLDCWGRPVCVYHKPEPEVKIDPTPEPEPEPIPDPVPDTTPTKPTPDPTPDLPTQEVHDTYVAASKPITPAVKGWRILQPLGRHSHKREAFGITQEGTFPLFRVV